MQATCECGSTRCKGTSAALPFVPRRASGEAPSLVDAVEILRKRGLSDDQILTAIGKAVGFDFKAAFAAQDKRAALMARASKGLTSANTSAKDIQAMMHGVSHELRILARAYRANREG